LAERAVYGALWLRSIRQPKPTAKAKPLCT
jgi:hypothetical protein